MNLTTILAALLATALPAFAGAAHFPLTPGARPEALDERSVVAYNGAEQLLVTTTRFRSDATCDLLEILPVMGQSEIVGFDADAMSRVHKALRSSLERVPEGARPSEWTFRVAGERRAVTVLRFFTNPAAPESFRTHLKEQVRGYLVGNGFPGELTPLADALLDFHEGPGRGAVVAIVRLEPGEAWIPPLAVVDRTPSPYLPMLGSTSTHPGMDGSTCITISNSRASLFWRNLKLPWYAVNTYEHVDPRVTLSDLHPRLAAMYRGHFGAEQMVNFGILTSCRPLVDLGGEGIPEGATGATWIRLLGERRLAAPLAQIMMDQSQPCWMDALAEIWSHPELRAEAEACVLRRLPKNDPARSDLQRIFRSGRSRLVAQRIFEALRAPGRLLCAPPREW